MSIPAYLRQPFLAVPLALLVVTACDDGTNPVAEVPIDELMVTQAPENSPVKDPFTALTRNLYHGGDIGPVMAAGFSDPDALMAAANAVWDEVTNNPFDERVVAIVDEIEASMPDLVGLQEAVQFVHMGLPTAENPTGVTVIDFVQIIEAEILTRGLPYEVLWVQDNTVIQVPLAMTPDYSTIIEAVQLTDRIAVLGHTDLPSSVVTGDNYDAKYVYGPLTMIRGWIQVDVEIDGVPYHFVNTHLETQSFKPIQEAQAGELLELVDGLDGVTVLLGDFNSDAAAPDGAPTWTETYDLVTAEGFTDVWAEANPGKNTLGLTCCHASNLENPFPDVFYQRIDFIFYKLDDAHSNGNHFPGAIAVEIVGDKQGDRIWPTGYPAGLWPSDHAGLVADFFWAPGQMKK